MNKYQANALEVALDGLLDDLNDIKRNLHNVINNMTDEIPLKTLIDFGPYMLKLMSEQLEFDIDDMKECIKDEHDQEEIEYFTELLNAQQGALKVINNAIDFNHLWNDKKPSREIFGRALDHIISTFKVFEYSDLEYNNRDEYGDLYNDLVLNVIKHIENKNN
jgi:hypothetical protein